MAVLGGRVFDQTRRRGIPGVRIEARLLRRVVAATTTAASGAFQLQVPDGRVVVTARATGFRPGSTTVVARGRGQTVNLFLEPAAPIPPDEPDRPDEPERPEPSQVSASLHSVQVLLRDARVDPGLAPPRDLRVRAGVATRGGADAEELEELETRTPVSFRRGEAGRASTPRLIFDGVVPNDAALEIELRADGNDNALWSATLDGPVEQWPRLVAEFAGARRGWTVELGVAVAPRGPVRRPTWGRLQAEREFVDRRRDRDGRFDPDWIQGALASKRLARLETLVDPGPGVDARLLEEAAGGPLCLGREGERFGCAFTEPPADISSFGAAGRYVEVEGDRLDRPALLIPVQPEALAGLDPASVRAFLWDETYERFQLVPASGFDVERRVLWARAHRGGVYGVFGLPADLARLDLVQTVCRIRGWLRLHLEGVDVRGLRDEVGRLCQLILCRPELHEALANPAVLEAAGLEDRRVIDLALRGAPPVDEKGRPMEPAPVEERAPPRPPPGDLCGECTDTLAAEPLPDPDDPLARRRFRGAEALVECQLVPRFGGRTQSQWYSIGPSNHGGRVKALAWHPTNPDVVYAGNAQGGVWYSPNGGRRWYPRTDFEDSLVIGDLALAPSRPARLYAATGEYFDGGSSRRGGIGVYVSDDGGWSWTLSATSNRRCSRIAVDPTDPDVVYLAGTSGLERSVDGGTTWQVLVMGRVDDVLVDPVDPDTIYVARDSTDGLRSIDQASTRPASDFGVASNWTSMNTGLVLTRDHSEFPWENYLRLTATVVDGETRLWCQINSLPDPWSGQDPDWLDYGVTVYRWDGSQWDDRGDPGGVSFGDWCSVIAIEPGNPDVVYSGRSSSWWTADGGENWHRAHVGHADCHAFAFDPSDPRRTLAGHDGGIYQATRRDENGEPLGEELTWDDANDGHRTIQFERIAVSEEGPKRIGGSTQDKGVLVRGDTDRWDGIGGAEWGDIQFAPRTGDVVVWDPKWDKHFPLLRSEDGGGSRRRFDAGLGQRHTRRISIPSDDDEAVTVATLADALGRAGAIRLPHQAANGMNDFTFCAWVRTEQSGEWTIVSGANAADDNAWTLFVDSDGRLNSFLGSTQVRATTPSLSDGDWHHVTWVRSGRVERLLVDGSDINVVSGPPSQSPPRVDIDPGGLVLGQEQDRVAGGFETDQGFEGAMADVRIYSRALNDSEIDTVMGGGDVGSAALRGHWTLEGPFDGLVKDESAAGRDGAPENVGLTHDGPRGDNAALFPKVRTTAPALFRWRDAGLAFGFRYDGFMPVLGSPVLRLPGELLDNRANFSVGVWVRSDDAGGGTLLSGFDPDPTVDGALIWRYAGLGDFVVGAGNATARINGSIAIDDGSVHHLALVRSSGTFEVFVDGVSAGTATMANTGLSLDPDGLLVGQRQVARLEVFDNDDAWTGDLQDLVVYQGALSDARVQAVASAGVGGAAPSGARVVARYPLDGDARDVAGDGWHGVTEHVDYSTTIDGVVARFGPSLADVRDLVHSPLDPLQLYAVDAERRIWHSRDRGFHWEHVGDAPSQVDPAGLAVDWMQPFRVYVSSVGTGRKHAWRSDDGGSTWTDIDGTAPHVLPDTPTPRVLPSDRSSDTLFAATDVGVYRTDDGGATWYAWDQGLPNAICTDIALRPANGTLYASTYGRGAWGRKI